jgi:putative addiction module component (TIGR02574 family)
LAENTVGIQSLTVSERTLLAEALWDSIVAEQVDIALTDAQKEELDRRLAAFEIDQDEGSLWSSVKGRTLQ